MSAEGSREAGQHDRLFPFCDKGIWGYIDRDGVVRIAPQFEWADEFSEGRAEASAPSQPRSGYIDEHGEFVFLVPEKCYQTRPFSEGLAAFSIGDWLEGKWGYLDRQGKVVIPPKYDDAYSFCEGLACVNVGAYFDDDVEAMQGGKWGFIDKQGHWVVRPSFDSAHGFRDGLAMAYSTTESGHTDRSGFIDRTGKFVLEPAYTVQGVQHWVNRFDSFSEGLARVEVAGLGSGFIDKTGKMVIPPGKWGLGRFSEGLARAKNNNRKTGYIDRTGAIVIQPRFDEAKEFSEGLAAVRVGERWGYIDKKGDFVIPPDRRQVRPGLINDVEEFRGGLARVHIGGKLNDDDMARTTEWRGGAWYYMNRKGEIVRRVRCDDEEGPCYGSEWRP